MEKYRKGVSGLIKLGSIEAVNYMLFFFNQQLDIVNRLNKRIIDYDNGLALTLVPLVYSIKDSAESICLLTEKGKLRDCFVVARTIFETVVNACSIGDLVDNAHLCSHSSDPFWEEKIVIQRIERISLKYGGEVGTKLNFGHFSMYDHASEITHGTLLGALFILGYTDEHPPQNIQELKHRQLDYFLLILFILGLCLSALIQIVQQEMGEADLLLESNLILKELVEEPWLDELTQRVK